MPQARPRNKTRTSHRQDSASPGRNEPAGRSSGKNAAKFQQKGADARGQRGMQGARGQRVNNQRNQNNLPAQQRERDEYGSVRGREFVESYESDADQPRSVRGREGYGGYDVNRSSSGRGSAGREQPRSGRRASGYQYQEEDFEEGGQNEANRRSRSGSRAHYDAERRYSQSQQHDQCPTCGRSGGQYDYEGEGDWERADQFSSRDEQRRGGHGDQGGSRRYGNGNRVPAGVEGEEFLEGREYGDRSARRGQGQRGNGGSFESTRGEYADFNAGRGRNYEDTELNDYTDARVGSNARRGRQSRSKQGQSTGRKNAGRSASSSRQQRSARAGR